MTDSARFHQLERRIAELRKRLLPAKIDATSTYSRLQIDRTLAFTVLAHAEIEEFLEDMCETAANRAIEEWEAGKRVGRTTLGLISFYENRKRFPEALALAGKPVLTQRLEEAKQSLTRFLRVENNGIREANLVRMLLPVGLLETDIPADLPDLMNELSDKRGAAAHTSAVGRVVQMLHPDTEYTRIVRILSGIKLVEERLRAIEFH